MRNYLIDTFKFNDSANRKLLPKINELPEKDECIKLFSHLINCQYKWMAGIKNAPNASVLEWWNPVYPFERLESEWQRSLEIWLDYLAGMTDEGLSGEIIINNFDGASWAVKPQDIAIQLNYHSIHHRAQIQYLIRKQGVKPDFLDYIRGRFRKI
ncbi:MAG TPA: DinB family protein [Ignavibacteria bacterium]